MTQLTTLKKLKKTKLYSEELGIDLSKTNDHELFKWFLASVLFGARISETIAKNTYRTLEKYNLLTPTQIINAGFDYLVSPVMKEGGYVRYDMRTSTKLLRISHELRTKYKESLNELHNEAKNDKDLEARLKAFYGVGPITINIFLRELRPFWEKANPEPLPIVNKVARQLSIDLNSFERKSINFVRIEAGLVRRRKIVCKKTNL